MLVSLPLRREPLLSLLLRFDLQHPLYTSAFLIHRKGVDQFDRHAQVTNDGVEGAPHKQNNRPRASLIRNVDGVLPALLDEYRLKIDDRNQSAEGEPAEHVAVAKSAPEQQRSDDCNSRLVPIADQLPLCFQRDDLVALQAVVRAFLVRI